LSPQQHFKPHRYIERSQVGENPGKPPSPPPTHAQVHVKHLPEEMMMMAFGVAHVLTSSPKPWIARGAGAGAKNKRGNMVKKKKKKELEGRKKQFEN